MTTKRKRSLSVSLQRRVKPQKEEDEEVASSGDTSSQGAAGHSSAGSASGDSEEDETDNQSVRSKSEAPLEASLGEISFGALARAQASLSTRSPPAHDPSAPLPPKYTPSVLRQRLQDLREKKQQQRREEDDGIRSSNPHPNSFRSDRPPPRSSKHAPTALSSRHAVSRRREIIAAPRLDVRDPRFEPVSGPVNEEKLRANYQFLDGYRDSEMRELKDAIRGTKGEEERRRLKTELLRMESRKKAAENRAREQQVVRKHRKEEKESIREGKQPFYLKKAERKRLALVDRYSELSGKQLERVMERREKKKAGMEKKRIPDQRRAA